MNSTTLHHLHVSSSRGAEISLSKYLLVVVLALLASLHFEQGSAQAAGIVDANSETANINWQHWQASVFASAAKLDRMIMVNVGYEGCTACRFMDENTFQDPKVIELLNKHFVTIQVDSEARPDIGERYSDWAWPATAFMHPDGTQIFALRGSRRADKFIPMLKNLVARQAAGTLKTDTQAPYGATSQPTIAPLPKLQRQVRDQLDSSFDAKRGGWGRNAKILENPGPTLQLFIRGYLHNDEQATSRALLTSNGFSQQTDTVWGGVFYASLDEWTNTIKEKRLETQAAALRIFSDALQVSSNDLYRTAISEVDRYLLDHMQAKNGLFFSSQKDLNRDLERMDSDQYYALGDADRRAVAYPKTDHATYTDLNARVAHGYIRAYQATGNQLYLKRAEEIMNILLSSRLHTDGWYIQLSTDETLQGDSRAHVLTTQARPFLRTQAYVATALLKLYQASDDAKWLAASRRLASAMQDSLEDKELGGFFATSKAAGISPSLAPRKPLEDNAVAAMFFYWLGVLEKDAVYRDKGESTIRAVASPDIVDREGRITGNLAIALELLINGYVEMSVVGDKNDASARALFSAAQQVYEPRKIVHFEAPGRYPKREHAAIYICNDTACSLPIADPSIVAAEAEKFAPHRFVN